jgi:NAD(P) transhydrogenase
MAGTEFDYDLVVLGTGPAGQRAAIAAAKAGHRVAIIEKKAVVGGLCINTGTIPSKSLREAVLYLSGWREHAFYGESYAVKHNITINDLLVRCNFVIKHELDVIEHQMYRNGVDLLRADAAFADPHTLDLLMLDGSNHRRISGEYIVIATGTEAAKPHDCTVDGQHIFTSDGILTLDRIPRTLAVIGAGVIGCEYASMFAALDVRVTLIDARPQLLSFVDEEITDALAYHLREHEVTLRLGETVSHVEVAQDGHVATHLQSGKHFLTEKALYSVGRVGATTTLNLAAAGLTADDRGRLVVNEHYQTTVPHIYAAGDVIGFPALASTSMEQGRLAAAHAFGLPASSVPALFPYGIYTIPEISMVGKTEAELTKEGLPYEVGKAQYKEIARGQIIGDQIGFLKLIFHCDTEQLLGVHIIGEGAAELVHIGQAVISFGGTAEYFINTVFNYPTLAECYKVATFDALNRIRG